MIIIQKVACSKLFANDKFKISNAAYKSVKVFFLKTDVKFLGSDEAACIGLSYYIIVY